MKNKNQSLQTLPSDEDISLARISAEEISRLLAKLPLVCHPKSFVG